MFNTSCFYSNGGTFDSGNILYDGNINNKFCDEDWKYADNHTEELKLCPQLYDLRVRDENGFVNDGSGKALNATECGYIGLRESLDPSACTEMIQKIN